MLKPLILAAALACATPAAAQESYLVYPTQSACQARSQQECVALGCDGVQTQFWWLCTGPFSAGVVGITVIAAGSYGLTIDVSGPFGVTATTKTVATPTGLSAAEQLQLLTAAQLAALLPVLQVVL